VRKRSDNRRALCSLGLAFAFALPIGCASTPKTAQRPTKLDIVYTANLGGKLDTCGCKKNPLGGLPRKMNYMQRLRSQKSHPILVDSGDMLFEDIKVHPLLREQFIFRGYQAVQGFNALGTDVYVVGERDFAAGLAVLKELLSYATFPVISANLVDAKSGNRLFPGHTVITREGVRIAFVGLSCESDINQYFAREVKALPYEESLRNELKAIEGQADLTVVVVHDDMPLVEALAEKFSGVPLWISGDKGGTEPAVSHGKMILNPMLQAQSIGHLSFEWTGRVENWARRAENASGSATLFDHEMVSMDKEFEGANALDKVIAAYRQAVSRDSFNIESVRGGKQKLPRE
jgi:2',3'-cyclic-nucleotide 2'-phosphodiesterase (5'-nucleotidase family)